MSPPAVAFLRGINVGGRRIDGAGMVDVARRAGFADAVSYQASGNLVVETPFPRIQVEERLSTAFDEERGWDVDVFVRTLDELRTVIADVPFSPGQLDGLGKPQVGFAHEPVDVSALTVERDLVAAVGDEFYWVPHTGVSDADLDLADFTRVAGSLTMRTLGTVERMVAKFG